MKLNEVQVFYYYTGLDILITELRLSEEIKLPEKTRFYLIIVSI